MRMTPEESKANVERLDAIFEKHVVRKPFSWSDVPEGRNLVVINESRGCYLIVEEVGKKNGLPVHPQLEAVFGNGERIRLNASMWAAAVRP